MGWYLLAWKRAFDVYGRSRRKEYWTFQLVTWLLLFAFVFAGFMLFGKDSAGTVRSLASLYYLAVLAPMLTCTIRRLHDTGKSGWWVVIGLLPLIGLIVFVFTLLDSDPGPNKYGANPKSVAQPTVIG